MILNEDWIRKSGLLMKSHEMTNFTLESRAFNPMIGLWWNIAWSLLVYFPTLFKDLIPIGVR